VTTTQSAQCNDGTCVVLTWTLQWNTTLRRIRLKGKIYIKGLKIENQSHYRFEQAYSVGRGVDLLFLDLGATRGWMVSTTPRPLYPRERPGTHCTGGWVDLRAGLDVCEKSRRPGFDPRTVQPVASHYTD
jgi:hypothetical protein